MVMKRCVAVLAAVVALTWAVAAHGADLAKVRCGMGVPTVQALTLNVAIGEYLGYYKEEGLSLTLHGMGNNTATLQALAGGTNQVSVVVAGYLLPLAAKGDAPPVKVFYNYTPKFKYDVVVNPDSPVKTLGDLKGKPIGIPAFGHASYPVVKALAHDMGWDPDKDLRLVAVGFGPTAGSALRDKRVDGYFAGDTDFSLIETQGFSLRFLKIKPAAELDGIGGFYIGAMEDWIRKNPKLALGVARGIAKGTVFAKTNLEAAAWIFMKLYPESVPKGMSREQGVKNIAAIVLPRSLNWMRDGQKRWGEILKKEWENEVKFLDLESKIPDVSKYFTNEFIDEANKFDAQKIVDQAKAFKIRD
jgi:NitT/TauT family transport system substrate-binding protein